MKKKGNKKVKFAKPDAKWYKKMKILFAIFLGLVALRGLMFLAAGGKLRTDDIWLRILLVSFGTLVAWWYVKKRN
ncbi:MAG: hypothetical protein GXW85_13095 [Clostridia bacterium]|nr:hypothetical protein [Clostridia bacterium]